MKTKDKMKLKKDKKGIALITLVITIVVILILSVTVILTLFSQNGVLNNAKKAVNSNNIEVYKEAINAVLQKVYIETKTDNNKEDEEFETYTKVAERISSVIPDAEITTASVIVDDYLYVFNEERSAIEYSVDLAEVDFTVITGLEVGDSDDIKQANLNIINSAINSSEQYIYIPAGEYNLSGTILIDNQQDKYIKMSEDTTLSFPKQILNSEGKEKLPRILIQDSQNIIIDGGNIDAGYVATKSEVDEIITSSEMNNDSWYNGSASTVYISTGEDITVGDNTSTVALLSNELSENLKTESISIRNMKFENGRSAAIRVGGKSGTESVKGISISNIKVSNNFLGQGIAVTGAENLQIYNCVFENVMQGIDMEPPNFNTVERVVINNVTVDECAQYGIVSQTSFYDTQKLDEEGNPTLVSNHNGRNTYGRKINDITLKNITVESYETTDGNAIVLNGIYGIDIKNVVVENAKRAGIYLRETKDVNIENVDVSGSKGSGIQLYNPIDNFNTGKISINNAAIYDNECIPDENEKALKGAVNIIVDGENAIVESLEVTNSKIYNNGTSGLRLSTIGTIKSFLVDNLEAYGNGQNSNPYGILIEGYTNEETGQVYGLIEDGVIKNSTLWKEEFPTQQNTVRLRHILDTSVIRAKGKDYNNPYLEEKAYYEYENSSFTLDLLQ